MNVDRPLISVIIPTHNRQSSLQRLLETLCRQTVPLRQVEVLVVVDGCSDGTAEMLRGYEAPFRLRMIEQPGQGPAIARNLGASQAVGDLLLFLDDDVEPTPCLIEAHIRAHRHQSGRVIIGPYPLAPQGASFLHINLRAWWETVFQTMGQPGHRFTYQDLLSGNFSIEAELFARIGGFDPASALQAHEDYELGLRLIKANVPFGYAAEALAYHHDQSDFNRTFRRKRQEGRADVFLVDRYPEILPTLPLVRFKEGNSSFGRFLRGFAFNLPHIGDVLVASLGYLLDLLERGQLRNHWAYLFANLSDYWYWRGVAEESGSRRNLANLLQHNQANPPQVGAEIELDLSQGIPAAERRLDQERPATARIRYGSHFIGLIPAQPGAEPLQGAHLRPILADVLTVPFLEALILEGIIPSCPPTNRLSLAKSIGSKAAWFGPLAPGKMWFEQYSQWKQLKQEESQSEQALKERWDRFRELERETACLERERAYWQRLVEEQECIIREQQNQAQEPEKVIGLERWL